MENRTFELTFLPNIEDTITKKTKQIRQENIKNYLLLKDHTLNILNFCINNSIIKPLAMYNLFFYIELHLKVCLALKTFLSINEIENYGHDIYRMMNYLHEGNNINFQGFKYLIDRIEDCKNNKLDFSKYYNYKYNKEIGNENLIFSNDLLNNDIKKIKDVIEWLNLHIAI